MQIRELWPISRAIHLASGWARQFDDDCTPEQYRNDRRRGPNPSTDGAIWAHETSKSARRGQRHRAGQNEFQKKRPRAHDFGDISTEADLDEECSCGDQSAHRHGVDNGAAEGPLCPQILGEESWPVVITDWVSTCSRPLRVACLRMSGLLTSPSHSPRQDLGAWA
jgi:hypothetical protein